MDDEKVTKEPSQDVPPKEVVDLFEAIKNALVVSSKVGAKKRRKKK